MIALYDLNDNLVTIFDTYKDCAKWFNTSADVIKCYICRSQKGILDKKLDKETNKWYRLFKVDDADDEI